MALSATFTANFASFYDAVDKAEAKLKDFGAGADKVGGRLNALSNSFSGVKIIQDATLMVKAVEEIGGVTKLTEKELARLGATANEAVAKMKLLGMDVPKNLQQIADQTKKANTATTDWMGSLTKIAGTLGIAFSVGAITNFIGSIFDAASAIKDLSDQWGVSTDAVQRWTGAAKQSGVETEKVGKSVQFLTEQLAEGSEGYQALLANVGLSYDKLRQMPLEDAYKEVIRAIASIKDETLQLDVAEGLLGKSAKQMVGAIRDGFLEAAAAQTVMSDETIKRLEAAQQQWETFTHAVVTYSGEMLGAVAATTKGMTKSWGNFFSTIGMAAADFFTGKSTAAAFAANRGALDDYDEILKKSHKDIVLADESSKGLGRTVKTQAQILEELRKKQEAQRQALAASTKATKDAEAAQDKYNQSVDDLVNTFRGGGAIDKANLYLTALHNSVPIAQMTAKAQKDINQAMWDAIVAFEAAGEAAPEAMYKVWIATAKAAGAIKDLQESLPTGDWIKPGSIDLGPALTLDPGYFQEQLDMLDVLWENAIKAMATAAPKINFEQSVGDLTKAFAQLGDITGGVFGEMTTDIANLVGAMNVASASSKTFQSGLANIGKGQFSTGLAQGVAGAAGIASAFQNATKETGKLTSTLNGAAIGFSVAGPWGAAVGAAAGLIKGFINAHKEAKEVKKLRNDFIEAAGGIDVFNKSAQAAGVSTEALFGAKKKGDLEAAIKSIQVALEAEGMRKAFIDFQGGVDALTSAADRAGIEMDDLFAAKTSDQVTAAIKEIEDALKFQEDAYQLAIDTAKKYGFTLEELGPAMARQELDKQAQQLFKDWEVLNSAGIDTVEITEHMADAVNAYVDQASAMGTEVPEAMRPMLQAMVDSGKLLDENGNAITDLEASGISFALSMSDGFKKLIEEVGKLTDAISRSLGLAIKEIPQPKITGEVTWDVAPIPSQPHGAEPIESYQGGTDGFKNFGAGTPVMLHGWEAVVPREESGAFATVSGGGGGAPAAAAGPSIVINAQGAFFDTPGDLQRLAARVDEALSARHGLSNKRRAG
jgi:hypothetical protein